MVTESGCHCIYVAQNYLTGCLFKKDQGQQCGLDNKAKSNCDNVQHVFLDSGFDKQ